MTLLFMDGFDLGDRSVRYTSGGSGTTSSTRLGYGLALNYNSTGTFATIPLTASSVVVVGFAANIALNRHTVQLFGDSRATTHLSILFQTDGSIEARRGSTSGTLLASVPAASVAVGVWHYFEIKASISDTVGVVEIRVDGSSSPIINFSGDTKNAGTATTIDGVSFAPNGTTNCAIDDVYILNTSGSANNDFLGDVRIYTLVPNGNGNSSQLVGSDGNSTDNYALVDEKPYSASDYVGSATATDKDTYAMEDLPGTVGSVFAVQEVAIAAKSDAGAGSMKQVVRRSSTDYATSSKALTTTYVPYLNLREQDPSTSSAWTPSGVNAAEAGMEVA